MATQAYFENIKEQVIIRLENANSSIRVAVAWFTDNDLFGILCKKASDGVRVELLLANHIINQNGGLDYENLSIAGGKLYFIGSGINNDPIMHHKFCIIDNKVLIFGSYNWTYKAKSNYENITVIEGDVDIILSYNDEFERLRYTIDSKASTLKSINLDQINLVTIEKLKNLNYDFNNVDFIEDGFIVKNIYSSDQLYFDERSICSKSELCVLEKSILSIVDKKKDSKKTMYVLKFKRKENIDEYFQISPFSEGLAAVRKYVERNKSLWGFINKVGEEIIPCQFNSVGRFSEGLAAVKMGNDFGYINYKGNVVISGLNSFGTEFSCRRALLMNHRVISVDSFNLETEINGEDKKVTKIVIVDRLVKTEVIDSTGKIVFSDKRRHRGNHFNIKYTNNILILNCRPDSTDGREYEQDVFLDDNGNEVPLSVITSGLLDYIMDFEKRYLRGKLQVICESDKKVRFINEGFLLREDSYYDIDKRRELEIDEKIDEIEARACKNGYYDEGDLESLSYFQNESYCRLHAKSICKIGGEMIINDFEFCSVFSEGLLFIKKQNQYFFINSKGEKVFQVPEFYQDQNENLPKFSSGLCVIQTKKHTYVVYNKKGEIILTPEMLYSMGLGGIGHFGDFENNFAFVTIQNYDVTYLLKFNTAKNEFNLAMRGELPVRFKYFNRFCYGMNVFIDGIAMVEIIGSNKISLIDGRTELFKIDNKVKIDNLEYDYFKDSLIDEVVLYLNYWDYVSLMDHRNFGSM